MKLTSAKILFFVIVFSVIVIALKTYNNNREDFDATGYFYNGSPEWFRKPEYDINKWFVNVYPDRIQPACLPYSILNKYNTDDMGLLNYYSSAYQFWRI